MRMTEFFGHTLKEIPTGVQTRSHELLLRGAYIHQVAAGIFSYLPLGVKIIQKITAILREEMTAIGVQEVNMPVVQPAELWQESGRWNKIGAEMGRLTDRKNRDMVLALTHEEAAVDLARKFVNSYRDLPFSFFHIQTKWRDDPRPRAGLIRVREFTMKDSYSFAAVPEELERQYREHYRAYYRIFQRCRLPTISVLSDTGMMGGSIAHEFMYLSEIGEDTILQCSHCGYSANRQVARMTKRPANPDAPVLEREEVPTPNSKTIGQITELLQVLPTDCAKVVFFVAGFAGDPPDSPAGDGKTTASPKNHKLVAAVIRGDMELNETKLSHLIGCNSLRPAEIDEIRAAGAVPGYASPVGIKRKLQIENYTDCLVVVDELILQSRNLVGGANREHFHWKNLNCPRDFEFDYSGDLSAAGTGSPCPECENPMQAAKAVEIGNIFQLGTFYSEAMNGFFRDQDGQSHPILMGSYGIGVGRLLSCIAEEHSYPNGLSWPVSVAPFPVTLVLLDHKQDKEIERLGQELYQNLLRAGVDTLFDDREARAGFKFKDADLIGSPIRLTLSKRSRENGGVELSVYSQADRTSQICPVEETAAQVLQEIKDLETGIAEQIAPPPYPEVSLR